ncbi:hypothetical protein NPX13_g2267 [Xylaria arbuscula]|uniref:Uncharacterized protein n=1 Tax=Xylaria arbuscula TaxID=114810 RepID=A0A9W8NKI5_9PEZI|nr:hypothetical protein NPX13_g2267 [Xylaria arbuscula]
MQTLRRLAEIPDDRFLVPRYGSDYVTYVHARSFGSRRVPEFQQLGSSSMDLLEKLAELDETASELSEKDITGTLTLVSLTRDRGENILIPKATFMMLFERFGIDQRFLQHIRTNRYGLHYDWDGQRVSYYVGTALYILMWSFDRQTRATRAILLSRDFISTEELGSLRRLLQLEVHRLHSPFLLAWVSLVHLSNWMDSSTYYLLTTIRQLEELTGYGPYGMGTNNKSEVPIEQLTQASKNVGYVQVNLANQLRHVTIGQAIASHISSRQAKLADYAVEPFVAECGKEIEAFNATIATLKRSLNDSSAYVYYLQERVRSQNTVVYALMQQADARININLAKASKELAEAAKKDRPSTLFVFAVWFGLHKWKFSRSQIKGPSQQLAGYEKLNGASTDSYHGLMSPPSLPPPAASMQYDAPTSTTSAPPNISSGKPWVAYSAPAVAVGDQDPYGRFTSAPATHGLSLNNEVRGPVPLPYPSEAF